MLCKLKAPLYLRRPGARLAGTALRRTCLRWSGVVGLAAATGAQGGVAVTNLLIDGRAVVVNASSAVPAVEAGGIKVSGQPHELQFHFGPDPRDGQEPVRLRYKLEGRDPGWRELDSAMRLIVRFYDAGGRIVAAHEIPISGDSPGWRGSLEASSLTPRRVQLVAPDRAAKAGLYISSGRMGTTTGLLAVNGVTLRIEDQAGAAPRVVRFGVESGDELGHALGVPEEWAREGSRPEMAQVLLLRSNPPSHAIVLVDDDINTFAAWSTRFNRSAAVRPGDRLTVEWEEAASIGRGGPGTATYRNLAAGNYWFRVAAVTVTGQPTGMEVSLPLVILPPLYERGWFWVALAGGGIVVSAWTARTAMHRRMQRELERLGRQRLLEQERARIARDIHDDLGANLAQIAMLSELAQNDSADPKAGQAHLSEIFTRAQATVRQLDEIVWAINPANDTIEHLAAYVCKFAQDYLALAKIRCRLDMPEALPAHPLTSAQRHNLFLAAKEALHNVVKHASASEVVLRLLVQSEYLVITVEDNGRGFDERARRPAGRGTANMRERIQSIGGTYDCRSTVGAGTSVTFRLQLPPVSPRT